MSQVQPPDADSSMARLFLIGVGIDGVGFTAFCQRHTLDLISASPDVHAFLLHSDLSAAPPIGHERLFGKWPRVFNSVEDLRDTLFDAIFEADDSLRGDSVGVVFVASHPKTFADTSLFAPLGVELRRRRVISSRVWTVGVLTCGPGFATDLVDELLSTDAPMFQNIFLLGSEQDAQGQQFGARHARPLRAIVDIVRDVDQSWPRLRPKQTDMAGRLMWFVPNGGGNGGAESAALLRYMKSTLESLLATRKKNDGVEEFKKGVEEQVAHLALDPGYVGEQTAALGFVLGPDMKDTRGALSAMVSAIGGDAKRDSGGQDSVSTSLRLTGSSWRQNEARAELETFIDAFRDLVNDAYTRLGQETRAIVDHANPQRERDFDEVSKMLDVIALPSGGFAQEVAATVVGVASDLEREASALTALARSERDKLLGAHRDLQARPDPTREGQLAATLLVGDKAFSARVEDARLSGEDLPTGWPIPLLLVGGVPLLAAVAVLEQVAVQRAGPTDSFDFALLRGPPIGGYEWISAGLFWSFVLLVPMLVMLRSISTHRRAHVLATTALRKECDRILNFIVKSMRGAQFYHARTRLAVMKRSLARGLRLRVQHEPMAEFAAQVETFFHPIQATPIDEMHKRSAEVIAGQGTPESWTRRIMEMRIAETAAPREWVVSVTASSDPLKAKVADGAAIAEAIRVRSLSLADPGPINFVPLQITARPATLKRQTQ